MRIRSIGGVCAAALLLAAVCFTKDAQGGLPAAPVQAQDSGDEPKAPLKPEVTALLRQSTAVYSAMRSYRHVSEYNVKGQGTEGESNHTTTRTLALERPNKFCYKSDEVNGVAAISDGKTFINYFGKTSTESQHTYYTRISAPASYKGINIVDDVTFDFGSYFVALMLQGDVLADHDVRTALESASAQANVEENGKKYDVLTVIFPERPTPAEMIRGIAAGQATVKFYFDAATHLLRKTTEASSRNNFKATEIIENILIDKPLPVGTFEIKLPKGARLIVGLPSRTGRAIARAALFTPLPLELGSSLDHADACSGPSF